MNSSGAIIFTTVNSTTFPKGLIHREKKRRRKKRIASQKIFFSELIKHLSKEFHDEERALDEKDILELRRVPTTAFSMELLFLLDLKEMPIDKRFVRTSNLIPLATDLGLGVCWTLQSANISTNLWYLIFLSSFRK